MPQRRQLHVVVIIGSTRSGRFGPTIAEWFARHAQRRADLNVDVVDLAVAGLPDTLTDDSEPRPVAVLALAGRLAAADAFVVVTPEYNCSFPAQLKTAIDWYVEEWQAKPVMFVSYGRESGGLLAAGQLRQIFSGLDAVPIRDCISLPRYWEQFAPDGSWPRHTAECNTTINATLDQLAWWAAALRDARATYPYRRSEKNR
ncbi:NADPH-dependent FMN reductase [Dactylosporangium sp. NPDC000521]|uniref:NADPH-dependent FMN reductase n=1 Tax=Dactylosporangium sp. NPDC000521 TaxID=3363975 RepID=UPI0036B9C3D3